MPHTVLKSKGRASYMPAKCPVSEPQLSEGTFREELGTKWIGNRRR